MIGWGDRRGVSATIGVVFIVGVLIVLAAGTTAFTLGTVGQVTQEPPPSGVIEVEFQDNPGDEDDWVRFTYTDGEPTGSKDWWSSRRNRSISTAARTSLPVG